MMLSDLSSDQEATGSSSHGGDMACYALSPFFLAPPAATTAPPPPQQPEQPRVGAKRKRSQPGNPDPEAEVIALSPRTLVATNRFVCEICNKGFQRDQNLQLHRRGHNLPWKLRQRTPSAGGRQGDAAAAAQPPRKRVYVCPEPTCIHHDPTRALGDLTGIKKHFSRKHGEKLWRCERCGKRYAVRSDWKAHVKGCGTREYRCDCGILFSRKDSLLTHRAFCDALAEETARLLAAAHHNSNTITSINGGSSDNNLLVAGNSTPLFIPFSNPPPAVQNPNNPFFLPQQEASFLQQIQHSTYLDLPVAVVDATVSTAASVTGDSLADAISFGLSPNGSVAALHSAGAGHRRLTRDFLGVDDGEVEELPQLPLCATDLTKQCFVGELLPPVNDTWSHNF